MKRVCDEMKIFLFTVFFGVGGSVCAAGPQHAGRNRHLTVASIRWTSLRLRGRSRFERQSGRFRQVGKGRGLKLTERTAVSWAGDPVDRNSA